MNDNLNYKIYYIIINTRELINKDIIYIDNLKK